jgi:hypothetical protein
MLLDQTCPRTLAGHQWQERDRRGAMDFLEPAKMAGS